jgi:hypothetical protein
MKCSSMRGEVEKKIVVRDADSRLERIRGNRMIAKIIVQFKLLVKEGVDTA